MSYATIMVHIEWDGEADVRAELAANLAKRFDAELIGVTAWMPRRSLVDDADLQARECDYFMKESQRLNEHFGSAISVDGTKVALRSLRDFPTDALAREARAADLLVVARDFGVNDRYLYPDPGAVVLKAGRPVLLVPTGARNVPGRRIVIAWKDTREARRAVHDALPFLAKAEHILLTEFCERSMEVEASQMRLADVASYLGRHHVAKVATQVRPIHGSTSDCLLQLVRDERYDLIVAGAYGHSRLGEWAFGGMTNELITHTPVCCLLSH